MKCFVALVLLSKVAIFAIAQESEAEGTRRGMLDGSEESGDFIRDILIAFEPILEKRGFREPQESHRPGGYEHGKHHGRGRHRGHHRRGKTVIMIPLYEECQNFTASMQSMFKELWTNREIGPSQCQGNFDECVKQDMEKVRCRVTEPPSNQCIEKVTQYLQGEFCEESEGNGGTGGSGGGNGGSGGGNGGSGGGGNGGSGRENGGGGEGNGDSGGENDP
ncbi:uncharacterized protein [Parasteatoda tepidariorum]|uniref:uncharacterized protein isoform X1 n=1 Tax=Parasteatoda tepidariorum TaxID=114398 RepID=UPI001C724D4E|nr:nucleolin isoform X1 [Parasteatoda tepidariorum]